MADHVHLEYVVEGDNFVSAGSATESVKACLKGMGVKPEDVRRVAISMYEGEINMVIHAGGGTAEVKVTADYIEITLDDKGPGIKDIDKAMEEGFSTAPDEIRSLGFGAGMGLPNMKRHTDSIEICSTVGVGTRIVMKVYNKVAV